MTWQQIKKIFDREMLADKSIQALLAKKRITYSDANKYAIKVGDKLGKIIAKTDVIPNGITYDEALALLNPALKYNYDLVKIVAKKAQNAVYKEAGLNIKAVTTNPKPDLIPGLAKEIADRGGIEGFEAKFADQITRFTMEGVDDTISVNAYEAERLGLAPKVVRKAEPNACSWCVDLDGEYSPEEAEAIGAYSRHDDCRCTIEYVVDNISTTVRNYKRNDKEREKRIENNLKRGR